MQKRFSLCGQVLKSGTYLSLNVETASDIIAAYPEAQRTAHAQLDCMNVAECWPIKQNFLDEKNLEKTCFFHIFNVAVNLLST